MIKKLELDSLVNDFKNGEVDLVIINLLLVFLIYFSEMFYCECYKCVVLL